MPVMVPTTKPDKWCITLMNGAHYTDTIHKVRGQKFGAKLEQ